MKIYENKSEKIIDFEGYFVAIQKKSFAQLSIKYELLLYTIVILM